MVAGPDGGGWALLGLIQSKPFGNEVASSRRVDSSNGPSRMAVVPSEGVSDNQMEDMEGGDFVGCRAVRQYCFGVKRVVLVSGGLNVPKSV